MSDKDLGVSSVPLEGPTSGRVSGAHTDLIVRLESAAGGTYQLDREIWRAVVPAEHFHERDRPPPYTVSLDAALRLVPAGLGVLINIYSHEKWCGLSEDHQNAERTGHVGPKVASARASTAPLAICSAALKARAITLATGGAS